MDGEGARPTAGYDDGAILGLGRRPEVEPEPPAVSAEVAAVVESVAEAFVWEAPADPLAGTRALVLALEDRRIAWDRRYDALLAEYIAALRSREAARRDDEALMLLLMTEH